jgi:hypothetical protein
LGRTLPESKQESELSVSAVGIGGLVPAAITSIAASNLFTRN